MGPNETTTEKFDVHTYNFNVIRYMYASGRSGGMVKDAHYTQKQLMEIHSYNGFRTRLNLSPGYLGLEPKIVKKWPNKG